MNDINVSPSLQDYLEAILNISEENGKVRITDISQEMDVAKSSVHQAVSQLKKAGLVEHERYGSLYLTVEGKKEAKNIKEKHEMLLKFFTKILGVDAITAQRDACLVEHFISPVTMEKLVEFLEKNLKV